MQYFDSNAKKYFYGLLALEILIVVLNILGGNFLQRVIMTIFRVVLLVAAHCCKDAQWASLYSVFCLLSAIFSFDPVGLFITGHGSAKTVFQNIACLITLILNIVAAYLGYLYAKSLNEDQQSAAEYGNPQDRMFRPINNPQPNNTQDNNYFAGTNYMYQQPSGPALHTNDSRLATHNKPFHAFSGQGYRLE